MEVKIIDNRKNGFEPVTLNVTITSEAELLAFWHRFNIGTSHVDSQYRKNIKSGDPFALSLVTDMWKALDKIASDQKITPFLS